MGSSKDFFLVKRGARPLFLGAGDGGFLAVWGQVFINPLYSSWRRAAFKKKHHVGVVGPVVIFFPPPAIPRGLFFFSIFSGGKDFFALNCGGRGFVGCLGK